ncbi:MAG: hypothetical protein SCK29_01975 [Bacillota bacterium]|nr:hypothetical protein [Bacillota bacterium]MDW7682870.1 hypothetical protein [Bacillota bacterium]
MRKIILFYLLLVVVIFVSVGFANTEDTIKDFADYLVEGDFRNASYYVSCSDGYFSEEAMMDREDYLNDIVKIDWARNMETLRSKGIYIENMKLTDFHEADSNAYVGYTDITIIDGDNKIEGKAKLYLSQMPRAQWNITKIVFEQMDVNSNVNLLEETLNNHLKLPPWYEK